MTTSVALTAEPALVDLDDIAPKSATLSMVQHPQVTLDQVTDEPTPEDLEQLARSVAMSGVLGDCDRLDVVMALRRLAEIDKATRRHQSGGRR